MDKFVSYLKESSFCYDGLFCQINISQFKSKFCLCKFGIFCLKLNDFKICKFRQCNLIYHLLKALHFLLTTQTIEI